MIYVLVICIGILIGYLIGFFHTTLLMKRCFFLAHEAVGECIKVTQEFRQIMQECRRKR